MDSIKQIVPKFLIKPNIYPKWFTPSLKHKIKCLRSLKKRYSRSPTSHIKDCLQAVELEIAKKSLTAHST